MVQGMPGCRAPTQSETTSARKLEESNIIKDGLERQHSLCIQNHKDSTQLPAKEEKLFSELACLSCLSFQGRSLSPQKKFPKLRVFCSRSRCLEFHNAGAGVFSALSLNFKGSMRKSCSQIKKANARIAQMTLPGLLEEADELMSDGIVKLTGHREAIAWNGFAPLQKVLVLAVTAAAATAANQKYSKEMMHLRHAIDIKEKDLENLQGKIGQLQEHLSFWKEQAQNLCAEAKVSGTTDKVFSTENASPLNKLGLDSTPKCNAVMLEQFETPQKGHGLEKMPEHVAYFRKNLRAARFRKGSYRFGSMMSKESPDEDNHEIRTFLDRLSESSSFNGGQYDASTPELPLTKLSMIDTPQLPFNIVCPQQVDHVHRYFQKGGINMEEDSWISPLPCTELILKDVIRQIQNNEAPEVMSALASVKQKVQMLESSASQISELSPSYHIKAAITDLNESIDQALAKSALLQKTIGGLQDAHGKDQNAIFSEENVCCDMLLKRKGQFSTGKDFNSNCAKDQEGDQTNAGSAVVELVVNSTVDTLLKPSCARNQCDSDGWSSEMVIEQLLGELESAAAKVATMEAQINQLKETEVRKQGFTTMLDKSFCRTCKEFDSRVRLLEDAEKKLATCREAINKKEKAISKLENENATLQELVSELRSIQVTPKVVTSNMLFNLDSPVKMDSPQRAKSPFCSWRRLDEASRDSTSLEGNSMKGSCDSDTYRSESGNHVPRSDGYHNESGCGLQAGAMYRSADENDHMPYIEGYKSESGCILQAPKAISCHNITFRRGKTKEHGMIDRSGEEEVSHKSSSSTDDLSRKIGTNTTRSSSDNSSSGSVASMQLPRPPRSYSGHARKLKFTSATALRLSDSSSHPQTASARPWRDAGVSLLNSKASNVLAGVELNTPMRDRKLSSGSKEKARDQSIDSTSKAKENFTQRRRWM